MKIVVVQTYPIYHDLITAKDWLYRINRDRFIPGILSNLGHEVELWGGDKNEGVYQSCLDGFGDYTIRLFKVGQQSGATKKHVSEDLVEHAVSNPADLYILKGTDGGIGIHLLEKHLIPNTKPYVFIVGGKYYTKHISGAEVVFYETERQKELLKHPRYRFWRGTVPEEKLIKLPKSVDTSVFKPDGSIQKKWDLVVVGRLIGRYKNYEPLGKLSEHLKIAVVGGGPEKDSLAKKYPHIDWIGQVPNGDVPKYLNMAYSFFHPGSRDYFPRVIPEAAACGCVLLGFEDALGADVIPDGCGIRFSKSNYVDKIIELLKDEEMVSRMGDNARKYALLNFNKHSSAPALDHLLKNFSKGEINHPESDR